MAVTIKDVAALAGVSPSTVSRTSDTPTDKARWSVSSRFQI